MLLLLIFGLHVACAMQNRSSAVFTLHVDGTLRTLVCDAYTLHVSQNLQNTDFAVFRIYVAYLEEFFFTILYIAYH